VTTVAIFWGRRVVEKSKGGGGGKFEGLGRKSMASSSKSFGWKVASRRQVDQ